MLAPELRVYGQAILEKARAFAHEHDVIYVSKVRDCDLRRS